MPTGELLGLVSVEKVDGMNVRRAVLSVSEERDIAEIEVAVEEEVEEVESNQSPVQIPVEFALDICKTAVPVERT